MDRFILLSRRFQQGRDRREASPLHPVSSLLRPEGRPDTE